MTEFPGDFWQLWLSTAALAMVSALASLGLGVPVGYWLSGLRGFARRVVQSTLLVPFLLPPFLVGGFFIAWLGREIVTEAGWIWLVLAHALMNIGFLASVTAGGLSAIERELNEAARVSGANPAQITRFVELPMLRRSLASAALLVAVYSSTSYGLVLMLGGGTVSTLETAVSQAALQRLALGEAGWLASGQLLLSLLMIGLAVRVGGGENPALFGAVATHLPSRGYTVRTIGWLTFGAVLTLLATLLLGAFRAGGSWRAGGDWTANNFANLAGRGGRDILNLTLLQATGNSLRNLCIALVIALPIAWWLARPGRRLTSFSLLPLGVSPVVLGLFGLLLLGQLNALGLPANWQWLLLPLLQAVLVVPVLLQLIAPARAGLDQAVIEAAQLDGANRWQQLRFVAAPLLARPLTTATAIGGLAILGEFGAASFLGLGSQATLSVALGRLLSHPGAENLGMFSAAAAVLVALTWLLLWILSQSDATATRESQKSHRAQLAWSE